MHALPPPQEPGRAPSALAPMQDVTGLGFMRLLGRYGPPDYFFTEYFRVHAHSRLERHIVASIVAHHTGRPVFAQLIGESLPDIRRTVTALKDLPIAGVDLNLGCPAPKVYRKNVGGGLLRAPDDIDGILGTLRDATDGRLSVKMRLGFEDYRNLDAILALIVKYRVDLLSVHGRTVKQMYRGEVDYAMIRHAVQSVPCPVLANGNITSAATAARVLAETGAHGAMIGRAAIRNPWIFRQTHDHLFGRPTFQPTLGDVATYLRDLFAMTAVDDLPEIRHLARLKKFMNFVGQSVDPDGAFLKDARRSRTYEDFEALLATHLTAPDRRDLPFADEPFAGVIARPNAEGPVEEPEQTCAL